MTLRKKPSIVAKIAILSLLGSVSGCGIGSSGSSDTIELSLVSYSTPQAAYAQLITAFQATPAGKNVRFKQSYGASGDQSRAVAAGLQADIVAFALEPDITRLVDKKLVPADWTNNASKGMVTNSVVVIGTREGNPKGIRTWSDLTKDGIEVITPNPFTSGGARWNVMAAYGAASQKGKSSAEGLAYLGNLFDRVPVQDDSARKSLQTFTQGKGDAFLSYENEAIFAKRNKQPIDYVVPDDTILIENPIAITKTTTHRAEAQAFLDFLHSSAGQKIYVENGYRPVDIPVNNVDFPKPPGLFTIADLGGWAAVTKTFFDPEKGALVSIESNKGVPVKK
jgi:sulfate/thiosulfate transport system substrate-binding protein